MEDSVKKSYTIRIRTDYLERIQDISYRTPGLTVSGWFEQAIESYLEKVPGEPKELKKGRPIQGKK